MNTSQDVAPNPDVPADEGPDDLIQPHWPAWAKGYLEALSKTLDYSSAADVAGLSRRTPERWRAKDAAFAAACYDAQERALDLLVRVNFVAGSSGLPMKKVVTKTRERTTTDGVKETITETVETEELLRDLRAGQMLLKRHRPEYRESFRIEQTGPGGGPVKHEVVVETAVQDFYAALDALVPSEDGKTIAAP